MAQWALGADSEIIPFVHLQNNRSKLVWGLSCCLIPDRQTARGPLAQLSNSVNKVKRMSSFQDDSRGTGKDHVKRLFDT